MKSPLSPLSESSCEKIPLLREALEVLVGELAALSQHRAEDLPELKKRKVLVASRLGRTENTALLPKPDELDLSELTTLIKTLETHSRQEIQCRLELLGRRLLALQEEHQYWRECLNVSFRKFCEPIPRAARPA